MLWENNPPPLPLLQRSFTVGVTVLEFSLVTTLRPTKVWTHFKCQSLRNIRENQDTEIVKSAFGIQEEKGSFFLPCKESQCSVMCY